MKGKARQESSFLPLNLSSESTSNTSLLGQTKTRVEVAPSVRPDSERAQVGDVKEAVLGRKIVSREELCVRKLCGQNLP